MLISGIKRLLSPIPVLVLGGCICIAAYVETQLLEQKIFDLKISEEQLRTQLHSTIVPSLGKRADFSALRLPSRKVITSIGSDLPILSKQNDLILQDVTYTPLSGGAGEHVHEVQVSMRIKGNYVQVKRLAQQLLATYNTLAITSMSMNRIRATDAKIDVEMKLSIFYGVRQ